MHVLIVAKTRMGAEHCCVGGLDLISCQNLRLMQPGHTNHHTSTCFNVGDIYDCQYCPCQTVVPPHVEDVIITQYQLIQHFDDISQFILQRMPVWQGGPEVLYDGLLCATQAGSGYICAERGIPNQSTGFWIPDKDLVRADINQKVRFRYPNGNGVRCLSYVGFAPPVAAIPAGSLLRVSLARWWRPADKPDMNDRCYLQLSGWY